MRVRYVKKAEGFSNQCVTIGNIYEAKINSFGNYDLIDNIGGITTCFDFEIELIKETDQHYNNTNGSLYKFAQDHELNAWEFDIIKRITRCRKKGQFKEDLEKTKRVIDLYLKEFEL
jgi:hypothetical protein